MPIPSKPANPSRTSDPSPVIEQAREVARKRGGMLISGSVPNSKTHLLWQCVSGHQWTAVLSKVKGGTWCPTCAGKAPLTIEDMQRLAAERLGACLSLEYINSQTPLQWRCSESHEWWTRPADIRQSWCPYCARTRKLELSDLRKVARDRGGILLSKSYVNNHEPLLWRCRAGHLWHAAASSVKPGPFSTGTWCPLCPRRNKGRPARLSIEEMQQIAQERGGLCVSKSYLNAHAKLTWRCAGGHEWNAKPASVKYGTWCPVCAGTQRLTLESLSEEAIKRGGRLLSGEYESTHSPLTWECAEGHQWQASASHIRRGTWCPHCAGRARLSIEEMHAIARANGGECLSKRYVNLRTLLKWRCANGHVWRAAPGMVKPSGYQDAGTWCPQCARTPVYTLDDMRDLAARRGGHCVSKTYINNDTHLKWRCAEGHTWEAKPNSIRPYTDKTPGTWCPVCALEKSKLTIEDMREVARARNGECLSATYVNSRTPLRWRCDKGHEWEARPNHVRPHGPQQRASWCPVCSGRRE